MNASTIRTLSLALAALLVAVPSARAADNDGWFARVAWGGTQGSGRVQTENRAVSGFRAIDSKGAMNLVLRQAGREGVELRGDDNILPLIETRVVDRGGVPTLEIGTRQGANYSTRTEIMVTVDVATLDALRLSGSGDVTAEALDTPALRVTLSGSGNLRMKRLQTAELTSRVSGSGDMQYGGRAARASFSISGSGDVDAAALEGDDVTVRIAGSGDAKVTARRTLDVSIAGSGDVSYAGDPVVRSSVAGSGSVRKR